MTILNVSVSITPKSSSLYRAGPSANLDGRFGFSVLLIRSFVDTLTGHQGDSDSLHTTHSDDWWDEKSLVIFQRHNKLSNKNDLIINLLILIASCKTNILEKKKACTIAPDSPLLPRAPWSPRSP